jgi:L-asparaginase II
VSRPEAFAPIAITRRSGIDESVHFGALVALDPSGNIAFAVGDPNVAIYPRSSNKPMQAVAMVRAGLRLPSDQLALACASHDGRPEHLAAATRILASVGLEVDALANTADLPLDDGEAERVLAAGGARTALQMNCSGKHAAMLATCVCNGWAHDRSYLAPDHPLQAHITTTLAELIDEEPSGVGTDGCGAPAHVLSLLGLARGFRAIATGAAGPAGDEVAAAMRRHPEMVGGPTRDVTLMMRHVPGLIAKDGAEGVFAAALHDGRAVALKVADGGDRPRPGLMVDALRRLGVDTTDIAPLVRQVVRGHGREVGEVRSLLGDG